MKKVFTMTRSVRVGLALACCFSSLSYAQEAPTSQAPAPQAPASQDAITSHAQPTNWNDTFIGYGYASDFKFPGSAADVAMNFADLTTTGGFKYGRYIFNAEYRVSDGNNPAAGSTTGAQEIYSIGRIEWSGSKIFGQPLSYGVIRDVGLTTGFDFSSKNDAYDAATRMLILGPTLDFAVPHGYWNLTAGGRLEDNYNGITHTPLHYSTAWHLESSWLIPFNIGPVPTVFKGFASVTGPKGLDGFHNETATETIVQVSLLFDVGALAGHPRTVYIGPGYQYWKNMYGTPASEAPGTKRSAPMLLSEFHF